MCFPRCMKKEKQRIPAETAQVSELNLNSLCVKVPVMGLHWRASCLVKILHWRELQGLLGVVDTSREYLIGGPYLTRVPLAPWTGSEMPLSPVRGPWRTMQLQARSDPATSVHVFGEGMHPNIQPALTNLPAALCSAGAAGETCTKEGKGNPARLVTAVKFLPWLEGAVQEIYN